MGKGKDGMKRHNTRTVNESGKFYPFLTFKRPVGYLAPHPWSIGRDLSLYWCCGAVRTSPAHRVSRAAPIASSGVAEDPDRAHRVFLARHLHSLMLPGLQRRESRTTR